MGRVFRRANGQGIALSLGAGKLEREEGASEMRAAHAHRPAVRDHEPLHRREAEADPALLRGRPLAANVRLENALAELLRDARAAVGDLEGDHVAAGADAEMDAADGRVAHVLEAVADEIREQDGEDSGR